MESKIGWNSQVNEHGRIFVLESFIHFTKSGRMERLAHGTVIFLVVLIFMVLDVEGGAGGVPVVDTKGVNALLGVVGGDLLNQIDQSGVNCEKEKKKSVRSQKVRKTQGGRGRREYSQVCSKLPKSNAKSMMGNSVGVTMSLVLPVVVPTQVQVVALLLSFSLRSRSRSLMVSSSSSESEAAF